MFLGSVHSMWYDETIQFNFSETNDLSDGEKKSLKCVNFFGNITKVQYNCLKKKFNTQTTTILS
jgi:hypothetical protein